MKKVLIICEYFYPGFKAGGPIQSITNLILRLKNQYQFSIITSAYDVDSNHPYDNIKLNDWNAVQMDGVDVKIYYADKGNLSINKYHQLIRSFQPEALYINGLFKPAILWYPLLAIKLNKFAISQLIVSPRGMLQPGALQSRKLFKELYLFMAKQVHLFSKVIWHATNEAEVNDIKHKIGKKVIAVVAENIPRKPVEAIRFLPKQENQLRLLYLSIITPKKNLHIVLEALRTVKQEIIFHIWGPIKEQEYWDQCLKIIGELPTNIIVEYKLAIQPKAVQEAITNYHGMILWSKGENFGHALYESFSVGRPIITSVFTPWNELQAKKAGWNIAKEEIASTIEEFAEMSTKDWEMYCNNAWAIAKDYYYGKNFKEQYQRLFN